MWIPAPSTFHFRLEANAVSKAAYANRDAYLRRSCGTPIRKAIKAFYDAGCRYLQFDDTAWAYLCSKDQMQQGARSRSSMSTTCGDVYGLINTALEASPPT